MITKILQAQGEELSRLLGEVFNKGRYVAASSVVCSECGQTFTERRKEGRWSRSCPYVNCGATQHFDKSYFYRKPAPIPLTWPEAMKRFHQTEHKNQALMTPRERAIIEWYEYNVSTGRFRCAIEHLSIRDRLKAGEWSLLHKGIEDDYLKIPALCVLDKEKK